MFHDLWKNEVDLSPSAVRQRLEEVGQLYELGLYLVRAKSLPDLNETNHEGPLRYGEGRKNDR